jgi:hypothetical protein
VFKRAETAAREFARTFEWDRFVIEKFQGKSDPLQEKFDFEWA